MSRYWVRIKASFFNLPVYPATLGKQLNFHTDIQTKSSSKSSHLERMNVAQFVYQIIFRVLEKFADIIFTYTHYHTSYTQFFTTSTIKLHHFSRFSSCCSTHIHFRESTYFVLLPAIPTDVATRDLYGNWGRKSNLMRSTYSFRFISVIFCTKIASSLFVTSQVQKNTSIFRIHEQNCRLIALRPKISQH